jgi:hypothetical protein
MKYLHTSKARYELNLWLINVKKVPEFIDIPLADFFVDKTAHDTNCYCR